jgi:hypothetical protein
MTNNPEEKLRDWEKEFDKEFKWFHINGPEQKIIDCPALSRDLKSFISSLLTQQKDRLLEKVGEKLKEAGEGKPADAYERGYDHGIWQAEMTVKQIIKEL